MAAAFGWGVLAGSSLVVGAIVAFVFRIPLRVIGLIMGFGAGVLMSAVAFDLVDEAAEKSLGDGWVAAGLFMGCLAFFVGDRLIDHLGGSDPRAGLSVPIPAPNLSERAQPELGAWGYLRLVLLGAADTNDRTVVSVKNDWATVF